MFNHTYNSLSLPAHPLSEQLLHRSIGELSAAKHYQQAGQTPHMLLIASACFDSHNLPPQENSLSHLKKI